MRLPFPTPKTEQEPEHVKWPTVAFAHEMAKSIADSKKKKKKKSKLPMFKGHSETTEEEGGA